MGSDMRGGGKSLYTKRACYLIDHWCSKFDTRDRSHFTAGDWYDQMGVYDITAEMAQKAHEEVPLEPTPEWLTVVEGADEDDYRRARELLTAAALGGDGISGSY